MFTAYDLLALVDARPFVPFRLVLNDGSAVEVPRRNAVLVGRHMAFVALSDATEEFDEDFTFVSYSYVDRAERCDIA